MGGNVLSKNLIYNFNKLVNTGASSQGYVEDSSCTGFTYMMAFTIASWVAINFTMRREED